MPKCCLFPTAFPIDFLRSLGHIKCFVWVLRRDSISAHVWYGLRTNVVYPSSGNPLPFEKSIPNGTLLPNKGSFFFFVPIQQRNAKQHLPWNTCFTKANPHIFYPGRRSISRRKTVFLLWFMRKKDIFTKPQIWGKQTYGRYATNRLKIRGKKAHVQRLTFVFNSAGRNSESKTP